jgi:hypothetical protein
VAPRLHERDIRGRRTRRHRPAFGAGGATPR